MASNRRLRLAEKVCREARYQIAANGGITDNGRLAEFVIQWITRAGKDKYIRPTPRRQLTRGEPVSETKKPKRIQRSRAKGWRMPEGCMYVGRPTIWGNPFFVGCHARIGKGWLYCLASDGFDTPDFTTLTTAAQCVEWYKRLVENGWNKEQLSLLRGRDLACWCPLDKPCHADILLELANLTPEKGT